MHIDWKKNEKRLLIWTRMWIFFSILNGISNADKSKLKIENKILGKRNIIFFVVVDINPFFLDKSGQPNSSRKGKKVYGWLIFFYPFPLQLNGFFFSYFFYFFFILYFQRKIFWMEKCCYSRFGIVYIYVRTLTTYINIKWNLYIICAMFVWI